MTLSTCTPMTESAAIGIILFPGPALFWSGRALEQKGPRNIRIALRSHANGGISERLGKQLLILASGLILEAMARQLFAAIKLV